MNRESPRRQTIRTRTIQSDLPLTPPLSDIPVFYNDDNNDDDDSNSDNDENSVKMTRRVEGGGGGGGMYCVMEYNQHKF
jgi:hypothetical protein